MMGRRFNDREAWFYQVGDDKNSIFSSPQFVDLDGGDGKLGFVSGIDYGADDNFTVESTSPAIDNGHPDSPTSWNRLLTVRASISVVRATVPLVT